MPATACGLNLESSKSLPKPQGQMAELPESDKHTGLPLLL